MKTKINHETFQDKLNRRIDAFVKLATDVNSKKISKSIKKASKIIAKAVTKTLNKKEVVIHSWAKGATSKKTEATKHSKTKATNNPSPKAGVRKINKPSSVKVAKKLKETPVVTSQVKTRLEKISPQ